MSRPLRILVSGTIAGDRRQGWTTWAVLQYVLGLRRLGHDVYLVEPADELEPERSAYFRAVVDRFGIADRSSLVAGNEAVGAPGGELLRLARTFDVLLDSSGLLGSRALVESIPIRVFLDRDPAVTQAEREHALDGYTHVATVGRPSSPLPTEGLDWIPTFPPVVIEHWPVAGAIEHDALTTVADRRGFRERQDMDSLRELADLPALTGERFVLALDVDAGERRELEALRGNGWTLLDAREIAGTPSAFASFVRGSWAGLAIARSGHVLSRCGWFGEGSACYLASGRPVVAQDTGFAELLPAGAGLFAFRSSDDVLEAARELRGDYPRHARAARAIAEEYLDSDIVLARLLDEVGAVGGHPCASVREASDDELRAQLPFAAAAVRRRPSAYRSSSAILELNVTLADGTSLSLLLKDLSRGGLTRAARRAKPEFLHDPLREIETYRSLLAPAGLGAPRFWGAVIRPESDRYWLVLEKVPGVELYQVGDLGVWCRALRWLARLHARFARQPLPARLLRYDTAFLRLWAERAEAINGVALPPAYEQAVERLAALPPTLVHGDFNASNVLVAGTRVCAVDWELAGSGPGVIDVAAITTGWSDDDRAALVRAYLEEAGQQLDEDEFERDLEAARLHLAARWLGWSAAWTPPPEHRQDWLEEARRAGERLAALG